MRWWNVAVYKQEVHNVSSFVLNRSSLSIARCMSRYEADLTVCALSYFYFSFGDCVDHI